MPVAIIIILTESFFFCVTAAYVILVRIYDRDAKNSGRGNEFNYRGFEQYWSNHMTITNNTVRRISILPPKWNIIAFWLCRDCMFDCRIMGA